MKELSVIIPIKDEPAISSVVKNLHRVLASYDHEVIVVDESSFPVFLKNAKVIRQKSHGLGNAFVEGLHESKGDYIVLMDGDGQHRPQDIPKLLHALKHSDFVIGSKLVQGGRIYDSNTRLFVTKFIGKIASLILNLNVKDCTSGFAAMKRSVISKVNLNPLGFKIVLEAAYKLKQKGFHITEVPIIFLKRQKGESKSGFTLNGLFEAFRIFVLIVELKLGMR